MRNKIDILFRNTNQSPAIFCRLSPQWIDNFVNSLNLLFQIVTLSRPEQRFYKFVLPFLNLKSQLFVFIMIKLSVNINKLATLRNSRGGTNPDLLKAAKDIERFGADGITVHPRPDERHIRYADVFDLKKSRPMWIGEDSLKQGGLANGIAEDGVTGELFAVDIVKYDENYIPIMKSSYEIIVDGINNFYGSSMKELKWIENVNVELRKYGL